MGPHPHLNEEFIENGLGDLTVEVPDPEGAVEFLILLLEAHSSHLGEG